VTVLELRNAGGGVCRPPGSLPRSGWRRAARSAMTRRTALVLALSAGILAMPLAAAAQPPPKTPRIGILRSGSPPDPFVDAFRRALGEVGYVEGRTVALEYRWAEGRDDRLPDLAADLVRLQVDVIVASGPAPALAVKRATTAIPLVMPIVSDPVRLGLVASLARPGGNVTGFSSLSDDLPGKWVELLRDALPGVSRAAVLWDPAGDPDHLRSSEVAARALGLRLHALKAGHPDELAAVFAEARKLRTQALVVLPSPSFFAHRARLVELAARHRLPTIYHQKEFVVGAGGLMSYGADYQDLFRRAAGYVARILEGASPGDLPIERPTKFELVINLRTAKALGLTIPPSVLLRADEVLR
jgi:putative ABC transport system substrate-binding protein